MLQIRSRLAKVLLPLIACVGIGAHAQSYPAAGSTIRVIVPFSAGSGTDVMTRVLIEDVQKSFPKAAFIVENKPGANGSVAAEYVAHAAPDGYTLLLTTSSAFSANPWLFKQLRYDPVKDFTPIARTTHFPFILVVNGASKYKTLDDLLKHLTSGSEVTLGYGNSTGQVANAHLMAAAHFQAVSVPYKSTPPALVDLVGERFDAMFVDMASSQSLVGSGKVRALAVMADTRSALMPGQPALGEKFPGFIYIPWGGLVGPAGVRGEVVAVLNKAFVESLNKPEVRKKFASMGLEPLPGSPQEFAQFIVDQKAAWGAKIREAGIQPQ